MKQIKKTLALAAATVVAMAGAFGGMAVQPNRASALRDGYNGEDDTIYYFSDYYPSIGHDLLEERYGGIYTIVYDNRTISSSGFNTLVDTGYFGEFGDNCTVIIDLKTFKPSSSVLYSLFYHLKETEECKTMFISTYAETSFTDDAFLQYVDCFKQGDFSRTISFVDRSLDKMFYRIYEANGGDTEQIEVWSQEYFLVQFRFNFHDVCIFIDNKYLGGAVGGHVSNVYNASPLFRFIFDDLIARLGISGNYDEKVVALNALNIRLLTVNNEGVVQNILTGDIYSISLPLLIQNCQDGNSEYGFDPFQLFCGIGMSSSGQEFYSQGIIVQQMIRGEILGDIGIDEYPVYLLEVDEIIYGIDGLVIEEFGEEGLMENEGVNTDYPLDEYLEALDELLGFM